MIITIARECGCYGDEIGIKLAEKLKIPFYDKKKIKELARKKGVYEKYPSFYEEKEGNMFLSVIEEDQQLGIARKTPGKALKAVLGEESCVILGRCGNYAYEGTEGVFRIFLSGEREIRIAHLMEKHKVSRREAEDTLEKTDSRRKEYHRFYTGQEWGYAGNYDLCINDSKSGMEGTVEEIVAYLKRCGMEK